MPIWYKARIFSRSISTVGSPLIPRECCRPGSSSGSGCGVPATNPLPSTWNEGDPRNFKRAASSSSATFTRRILCFQSFSGKRGFQVLDCAFPRRTACRNTARQFAYFSNNGISRCCRSSRTLRNAVIISSSVPATSAGSGNPRCMRFALSQPDGAIFRRVVAQGDDEVEIHAAEFVRLFSGGPHAGSRFRPEPPASWGGRSPPAPFPH